MAMINFNLTRKMFESDLSLFNNMGPFANKLCKNKKFYHRARFTSKVQGPTYRGRLYSGMNSKLRKICVLSNGCNDVFLTLTRI